MLRRQPNWLIFVIIGLFSGFSFLVLYNLSKAIS